MKAAASLNGQTQIKAVAPYAVYGRVTTRVQMRTGDGMGQFEVKAAVQSVAGRTRPSGQTVIAAIDCASVVEIQAGELLSSTDNTARDAGATLTFTRTETQPKRFYRADAHTFWSSVDDIG